MKVSDKSVLFKFFLIFLVFFSVFSFSYSGTIKQIILDPLGRAVEDSPSEGALDSSLRHGRASDPTAPQVKKFSNFYATSEPYCRVGGMYEVNVQTIHDMLYKGRPGDKDRDLGYINKNLDLYYCKTNANLLNMMKVPQSWITDDLILYCNSGGNVIDETSSFDFIFDRMNTYRVCVLRNLNKSSDNVVIYGLDVGNNIVEDYVGYFFDGVTHTSPITVNLEYQNGISFTNATKTRYSTTKEVPYKEVTITTGSGDSMQTSIVYNERNFSEAKEYILLNNGDEFVAIKDIEIVKISVGGSGQAAYTLYEVREVFDATVGLYNFTHTMTGKNYFFEYDFWDKRYSIRGFDDDLNVSLLSVFNFTDSLELYNKVGISRVLFFRKVGDKMVYGYEKPLNSLTSISRPLNETVVPLYVVDMSKFLEPGQSVSGLCQRSLSKYVTSESTYNDVGVRCSSTKIEIISYNVDKSFDNSADYDLYAFNLFKNIIISLK